MHDFHYFEGGWMMFFWWFLIIAFIVLLVKTFFNSSTHKSDRETPLEILKRRYADGEIDREEFEEKKRDLLE